MWKKPIISIISGVLALGFTVYIALDTFVIRHVYSTTDSGANTSDFVYDENASSAADGSEASDAGIGGSDVGNFNVDGTHTDDSDAGDSSVGDSNADDSTIGNVTITDTIYQDDNISITITTYREEDTDIHVADIQLSSAQYLKTALAENSYGKNITETTSAMAEEHNAILAINGDYYGVQESGYVIRNGILYRSIGRGDQEDLAIYQDGSMQIVNENEVEAQDLLEQGVYNLFCFGPGLIKNGEIAVTESEEVDKAMTSNPRTAIGVIDDLHYVFVVADGRTSESAGLSLYQLAEFMQTLQVTTAYNLDGGGSSTMYFNGEVVNVPASGMGSGGGHGKSGTGGSKTGGTNDSERESTSTSERSVSDIVYIGY